MTQQDKQGHWGFRKFDGRYYTLKDWTKTRKQALDLAKKYRKGGLHLVRVAPSGDGYGIFLKTIGTAEPSTREVKSAKKELRLLQRS